MTQQTAPIPPHNLDAEESVLGALMLSPLTFDPVAETGLKPSDFYRESHGVIFKIAVQMNERGLPVDGITLSDELRSQGLLDKQFTPDRIHELAALVPAASNVAHYARIVRDDAACRALIAAGRNIVRLGFEKPGDMGEVIAQAEKELTQAVAPSSIAKATSITDGLDELLADIRHAYTTGEAITGASTGFKTLDQQLGGLWDGQLILLAARPSVGKSTLALNIAENFAERGSASLFFTLEMSKYELQVRSLARHAQVDSRILASGQMTEQQAKRLGEAAKKVKELFDGVLHVQDSGDVSVSAIRAEARRLARTGNLGLVVVDYLQLMRGTGEENRNQEVSAISRGLKLLARELNVPILALSQMSRDIERRAEKRPTLADLRDSGSLEQDADVVLFMHQPADYDPDTEADGTIEVIAAKARKGGTGTVKLAYNRAWSRLGDPGGGITP